MFIGTVLNGCEMGVDWFPCWLPWIKPIRGPAKLRSSGSDWWSQHQSAVINTDSRSADWKMDSNWILPPRRIWNVPASGWRWPVMRITLGFSLQSGQFVKSPRLLLWCQTLKLAPALHKRRHDQQKELQRAFFLNQFFFFFFLNLWIPNSGHPSLVCFCETGPVQFTRYINNTPPIGQVFLKCNKVGYINAYTASWTNKKPHSDVSFACLRCWTKENKRKNILKHFAYYHNQDWITAGVTLVLFSVFITFRKELNNIIVRYNCCYVWRSRMNQINPPG